MNLLSLIFLQSFFGPVYLFLEISRSKPGRQSFVWNGHDASKAFDRDLLTYSSTYGGEETVGGWIQVDLGGFYNVRSVVILNTIGNDSIYLVDFQIFVGTTDQIIPEWTSCFIYANSPPIPPGLNYSSYCRSELTIGRYVTLQKHAGPNKGAIVAAEITIYGIPNIPAVNLATSNTAVRQSSEDYENYRASAATDGDLYTCAFTATESVSLRNISGWWQVDLGESARVSACLIANIRKEYFEPYSYMKAFAVLVSNETNIEFNEYNLCYFHNSSQQTEAVLYLPCTSYNTVGRYVTVLNMLDGRGALERMDALSICEFYVLYLAEGLELPVTTSPATTTITTTLPTTTAMLETTKATTTAMLETTKATTTAMLETTKATTPTTIMTTTTTSLTTTTTIILTTSITTTSQSITTSQSSTHTDTTSIKTTQESNTTPQYLKTTPKDYTTSPPSSPPSSPSSLSSPSSSLLSTSPTKIIISTSKSPEVITEPDFTTKVDGPTRSDQTTNGSIHGQDASITDDNTRLRLGLGIGLGVGLGLLLLILIVILYSCLKRKKSVTVNGSSVRNGIISEKLSPISTLYVHPRTRLAAPRNNSFDGVDFSYVPDLPWDQGTNA